MFSSEKVGNYLQSVKFAGKADAPKIRTDFYITPADYDLFYEVSDRIAKQIFRKEGGKYLPAQELGKTILNLGDQGLFNVEIFPHNAEGADGAGQMIPACTILEVWADHLFSDKPDWSLMWRVEMPLDSHSLTLVHKYFQKECFITLVKTQDELPFQADDKKPIVLSDAEVESGQIICCQVCTDRATYLGLDQSAWCDQHVSAAVGVQVRKIKYTGEAA